MSKDAFRKIAAAVTMLSFTACPSTTVIRSIPSGAKLYLNGQVAGKTPYLMTDSKFVGTRTTLRLEKPGYETFNGSISRTEELDMGACVGGVFFLIPFLWIMKYQPEHIYELERKEGAEAPAASDPQEPYQL
jgi:hypothetical protein